MSGLHQMQLFVQIQAHGVEFENAPGFVFSRQRHEIFLYRARNQRYRIRHPIVPRVFPICPPRHRTNEVINVDISTATMDKCGPPIPRLYLEFLRKDHLSHLAPPRTADREFVRLNRFIPGMRVLTSPPGTGGTPTQIGRGVKKKIKHNRRQKILNFFHYGTVARCLLQITFSTKHTIGYSSQISAVLKLTHKAEGRLTMC